MSLKDAINDVHALTASAIKLGASQERHRIVGVIEKLIAEAESEGNYLSVVFLNKWLPLIEEGTSE